jgi:hypothetical protein
MPRYYSFIRCILALTSTGLIFAGCSKDRGIIIKYAHVGVKNEPQSLFAEELATSGMWNMPLLATNPQTSPILAEMNTWLIEKSDISILGSKRIKRGD